MGVDCYGWIEVRDPSTYTNATPGFPDWWSGVVRIHDIVDRDYEAYGYFFDVYRRRETAIAGRRGIPPQVSQEVLSDKLFDPVDPSGASWVGWNELQSRDWEGSIQLSPGWALVFSLMERLAAQYSAERVRLVVWFDHDVRVD